MFNVPVPLLDPTKSLAAVRVEAGDLGLSAAVVRLLVFVEVVLLRELAAAPPARVAGAGGGPGDLSSARRCGTASSRVLGRGLDEVDAQVAGSTGQIGGGRMLCVHAWR